jgi:hypothetical protein
MVYLQIKTNVLTAPTMTLNIVINANTINTFSVLRLSGTN